jgi:hypothetical protein
VKLSRLQEVVTNFYFMVPLEFVGLIFNLLIVVILGRDKTMNRTTTFLLQMLAFADISFYVLRSLCDIVELSARHYTLNGWIDLVYNTVGMLLSASETITVWMAVIITYQRYFAVSRPLHTRQHFTKSRAQAAVSVLWICSIIVYVPFFYLEGTFDIRYIELFHILFVIVRFMLPISLTVFLNIRLVVKTRNSGAFVRQQFTASGKSFDDRIASSHIRVTVTLIVIMIVFLICQLPMTTVQILVGIEDALYDPLSCSYNRFHLYLIIAYNFSECHIVVSSLADGIIYCIMGKRFRQILVRELTRWKNGGK